MCALSFLLLIRITDCYVNLDQQWLLKSGKVKPNDQPLSFSLVGRNDEINIYSGDGSKITNFLEIEKQMPRNSEKEEQGLKHKITFDDGYVDISEVGRVRVNYVELTYDVVSANISGEVKGEEIALAILRDVNSGKIKFFDKQGNVRQVE